MYSTEFRTSTDSPSLKKFLDYRLKTGNLEDETMEHSRYQAELATISKYLGVTKEIMKLRIAFRASMDILIAIITN